MLTGNDESEYVMAEQLMHFDTQPRAVDEWLENLPIAHIGETARQIFMALRYVNKQEDIPVKHLYHFLEVMSQPLSLILPELHKHFAGKPLPLSQKRRKVADLYAQLLRQAILGYEHVIAHSIELNRFGWKKVVTTSVHRIFYFSSLLLCSYRQLYMPYPKGMWQQLYWTYQLIEKYDLLGTKITGLGEQTDKSSISTEFMKLLLLSSLSPNLFKQEEIQEVIENMDIWLQKISIDTSKHADDSHTYAFALETDIPPGMLANNMNSAENQLIDVRYINLGNLLQFINKSLSSSKPAESNVKLAWRRNISRRTMLILLNCWGRPASRDGERRIIQGTAEVAIGISAIHYIISDGRGEPATGPLPVEQKADEKFSISTPVSNSHGSSLGLLGFTAERDEASDVWDSAYFEPEAPPPSWTESMRMKVYSYLNAKVLNISKGGFCIALPQNGIEHIQSGELLAIRGKTGQWQLGHIRWLMCPSDSAIRAGIKKLCQKIMPAQIHVKTESRHTQPIKCLVGEYENEQVLFLPNLPYGLTDKSVSLELQGKKYKLDLLDQFIDTPVGSAHYISLQEQDRRPAGKAAMGDGYEAIWANL